MRLVIGEDNGRKCWHYVLVVDNEEIQNMFDKQLSTGSINVADFGEVLKCGWSEDPPDEAEEWIQQNYVCSVSVMTLTPPVPEGVNLTETPPTPEETPPTPQGVTAMETPPTPQGVTAMETPPTPEMTVTTPGVTAMETPPTPEEAPPTLQGVTAMEIPPTPEGVTVSSVLRSQLAATLLHWLLDWLLL